MKRKNNIFIYALGLFFLLCVSSCKKQTSPAPIATSVAALNTTINSITESSAICTAKIENTGGASITEKGFCWSTNQNPTVDDHKMIINNDSVTYHDTIHGLISNTTYYVRSFAINEKGIAYGNEQSFTLWLNVPGPDVTDIDGNTYTSVRLGSQIWMVENLRTTKYRNGDLIGTTDPDTLSIANENAPEYQWVYKGGENNVASYGRLYTWYAITDSRNIAPTGWHIPATAEWNQLINYLGGGNIAGGKLKAAGLNQWENPNTGASDASGFKALPAGYKEINGTFMNLEYVTYFWSSTDDINLGVRVYGLSFQDKTIGSILTEKYAGFSVRCVKDN